MLWSTILNLVAFIFVLPPVLVRFWKTIEVPAQARERLIALPGAYTDDTSNEHPCNDDEIDDTDLMELIQQAPLEMLLWSPLWCTIIAILGLFFNVATYMAQELFYFGDAAILGACNEDYLLQALPGAKAHSFKLEDFDLQASAPPLLQQRLQ